MIHSYPWYVADWRSSETRIKLSPAERCLYRELLDYCWIEGSLPMEESLLASISAFDPKEFRKCWPAVKPHFFEREGRLFNRKVDERRPELARWHEQKRNAGMKSVEARRQRKLNGHSNGRSNENEFLFKPSTSTSVVSPLTPLSTADWVSPEDCHPDYWVPKLRKIHFKPSSQRAVEEFCVNQRHRLETPERFRDFMRDVERSLISWVAYWQSDKPQMAQKLVPWLDEEGWTKEPPFTASHAETRDY
jgi:uncharacterized protein YdaU (DUF1376 family)